MQGTSQTYKTLLAAGAAKEVQAIINDDTQHPYTQEQIVSATIRAAMLKTDLAAGNCIAKELVLVITNFDGFPDIPRMAKIQMEFRLNDGTTQSEWYPKGTYYIDTRDTSYAGVLTITAYDSMLLLETPFCTEGEQGDWPIQDWDVVREIRDRAGITLDSSAGRTIINHYDVQYPGFGEGAMTMRDVLGYIGSMYGGNWVITDDNKLRIIVLGDIPNIDTSYLINSYGSYITFGGYRINVG